MNLSRKYSKINITYNNMCLNIKEGQKEMHGLENMECLDDNKKQKIGDITENNEHIELVSLIENEQPTAEEKPGIEDSDEENLSDIIEHIEPEDNQEVEQLENIFKDTTVNDAVYSINEEEDAILNDTSQVNIYMNDKDFKISEDIIVQQTPTCTDTSGNCAECCTIFTNTAKRAVFGYEIETAACECHDICVEDVRDICVMNRTKTHVIPCLADGSAGCRGGFLPDEPPDIQSWRVLCAEASLSPSTGCDQINNKIEFEVVLRTGNTVYVVTPRDDFACMFHEFAKFPSGVFYPDTTEGYNQWRNELAQIDGSCKVIIIRNVSTATAGNDCCLVIDYTVVDKLWKHENLLVSAIKPYAVAGENFNVTIKQEFAQGHKIGACPSGSCNDLVN